LGELVGPILAAFPPGNGSLRDTKHIGKPLLRQPVPQPIGIQNRRPIFGHITPQFDQTQLDVVIVNTGQLE
jgi:hypothetical protein